MTRHSDVKADSRVPTASKKFPRAGTDGIRGILFAVAIAFGTFMVIAVNVAADVTQIQQKQKLEIADNHANKDFRAATEAKMVPKAAIDTAAGLVVANAEVAGTPDQALRALTTNEVEKWWKLPGTYHLKDWKTDLRVGGRWSVTVEMDDGKVVHEWGEFCEINGPYKFVKTKKMDANPMVGERETTVTFRFEPSPHGTLVTVRDEGFIGLPQAAYGTAENWEKVLGWLDTYLRTK